MNDSALMIHWLKMLFKHSQGTGFAFRTPEELGQPEKLGFIEVNRDIVDDLDTMFACRITPSGLDFAGLTTKAEEPKPAKSERTKNMTNIAIETGIEIPTGKSKRGRKMQGSKYPFDSLEVDQSFYISDFTADGGDAYKRVYPSVSAANERYAEVVPGETRINRKGREVPVLKLTRKFICKPVEGGVRVWRVQ
jgi:hypothetical protein